MDTLEIISGLSNIVFYLAILTIIGFLITWLVGKIIKNKTTKKVGRIGSAISGIVIVVSLIFGLAALAGYNQIATKRNQRFANYAAKYKSLYLDVASKAEDVGNNEQQDWSDAIDEADDADDFDPDKAIAKSVADNVDDIEKINSDMRTMKKYVNGMKENETDKHSFKKYQKSYTELKNLTNLVTSPSGSYNSFTDNFGKYDDSTANAYKEF